MLSGISNTIASAVCGIYGNVSGSVVALSEAVCDTVTLSWTCVLYSIFMQKDYDQCAGCIVLQYINCHGCND